MTYCHISVRNTN